MNTFVRQVAGLKCRFINALPDDTLPRMLVVLCHGFGASGDDLVDLAPSLIGSSQRIARNCQFVFPEAPVDLGPLGMPGGRAWWPINMARLAQMNQTKNYEELTRLRPDGMLAASEQLAAAVSDIQQQLEITDSMTVLGGFSQGAMVSTDVALRHQKSPAVLALFSGTLLDRDDWERLANEHNGCVVMQSHGTDDPVLPFAVARQLHELLKQQGFTAEFIEFPGGHTIPLAALQRFSQRLQQVLADPA
jgi:phospholipase/carboxylesterase